MTQTTTLAALAAALSTITSPATLAAIYSNPKEAYSVGEFPAAVLAVAPSVAHSWTPKTFGRPAQLWDHRWTAALYLFLGTRATPLNELHERTLGWPEAVARALGADLTLGSQIVSLGTGDGPVWTYQVGPLTWGDGNYWGIRGMIGVTEYIQP